MERWTHTSLYSYIISLLKILAVDSVAEFQWKNSRVGIAHIIIIFQFCHWRDVKWCVSIQLNELKKKNDDEYMQRRKFDVNLT